MANFASQARWFALITSLCVLGVHIRTDAQTTGMAQTISGGGYRIAGSVVSKTDGHPLARARVTIRDAKDPQKFQSLVTADDGRFEFNGLPAGKFALNGAKRGFITAGYDQHDQYWTAIVTGAGLETESLILRLPPAGAISGRVLDESGEPVRRATVALYYQDHSTGVDRIHQARGTMTDDLGEYEIAALEPGTYFLSAAAKPWYAVHPQSDRSRSGQKKQRDALENVDRSLDVAYPLTYYPDVTDAEGATPIQIRGGERLQLEIHLNPVPSLHLLFRVPVLANGGYVVPQLRQSTFDGSTYFNLENPQFLSPGLVEVAGVPAGHYDIRLNGTGTATEMNGVDLVKDGEEIDTHRAEATSTVKVNVQVLGESLPARMQVALLSSHRTPAGWKMIDAKGEAQVEEIPSGKYEVRAMAPGKLYSIARMSAEGATVEGHSLNVTAGSSPSLSLTLVAGSSTIDGVAKRDGKPVAGAMVVLVPKDPETNRDLFRRDQSDLDGTFSLRTVVPGSYTILAIENGWELDWSQPAVITAYLKRGQSIQVANQTGRTIKLSDAVDVQPK